MKRILEEDLQAIEEIVRQASGSVTAGRLARALATEPPRRTLQYRLKLLADSGRLVKEGSGRWTRYRAPRHIAREIQEGVGVQDSAHSVLVPPLSEAGAEIRTYVRQRPEARKPVGYDRTFLDSHRPNESFHLSVEWSYHRFGGQLLRSKTGQFHLLPTGR